MGLEFLSITYLIIIANIIVAITWFTHGCFHFNIITLWTSYGTVYTFVTMFSRITNYFNTFGITVLVTIFTNMLQICQWLSCEVSIVWVKINKKITFQVPFKKILSIFKPLGQICVFAQEWNRFYWIDPRRSGLCTFLNVNCCE